MGMVATQYKCDTCNSESTILRKWFVVRMRGTTLAVMRLTDETTDGDKTFCGESCAIKHLSRNLGTLRML